MLRAAAVAVVVVASAAEVERAAAEPAAPSIGARRAGSGAFLGLGLGGGNLRLAVEGGGEPADAGSIVFQFHLGGFVTERLAIGAAVAASSGVLDEDSPTEVRVGQSNLLVFAQLWLLPRLWLRAGAGSAVVTLEAEGGGDTARYPGAAFAGTVGVEVLHAPTYALSAGLHLWVAGYEGVASRSTTGAFGLEMTWF